MLQGPSPALLHLQTVHLLCLCVCGQLRRREPRACVLQPVWGVGIPQYHAASLGVAWGQHSGDIGTAAGCLVLGCLEPPSLSFCRKASGQGTGASQCALVPRWALPSDSSECWSVCPPSSAVDSSVVLPHPHSSLHCPLLPSEQWLVVPWASLASFRRATVCPFHCFFVGRGGLGWAGQQSQMRPRE